MPRACAKAPFLEGWADSTVICFSTSQLAMSLVPPNTPAASPLTLRVTVAPVSRAAVGVPEPSGGGVCCGGATPLAAVDSVNGSGPVAAAGWRNTSPRAVSPLPLGRVRTTTRATTAASATSTVASRGPDRHQGLPPGSSGVPDGPGEPGGPPGGAGGGGGGTPWPAPWPPESGPEGGPVGAVVGRSDRGCDECDGDVRRGGSWPEGSMVTGPSSRPDGREHPYS